ncbi:hypothetical protein ACWEWU_14010 [Staphylococcus xylosus]
MDREIEKLKSEKDVLNFLFGLCEIKITKSNVETISTSIYEKMLEHPTAMAWTDFRLAISKKNNKLSELININEINLESVIFRKYQEDARKTRIALFGYSHMDSLYTPE